MYYAIRYNAKLFHQYLVRRMTSSVGYLDIAHRDWQSQIAELSNSHVSAPVAPVLQCPVGSTRALHDGEESIVEYSIRM
jgi:hypothetical protein